METWKISASRPAGTLVNTFSLTEQPKKSTSQLLIREEVSLLARDSLSTACLYTTSFDHRMLGLEWTVRHDPLVASDAPVDDDDGAGLNLRYNVFVRMGALLEDYGYAPRDPIPYFVWSARNVCILQETSEENILELFNSSGRHACMASSSVVEIHDFVVPRYHMDAANNLANTELVRVDRHDTPSSMPSDLLSEDFRSYSLSYAKASRHIGFQLAEEWRTGVMLDNEHIIILKVCFPRIGRIGGMFSQIGILHRLILWTMTMN